MTIRPAAEKDVPSILGIEQACLGVNHLNEQQAGWMTKQPDHIFLVAAEEDAVVGYILAVAAVNNGSQQRRIISFGVHPSHNFLIIGGQLLEDVEKRCSSQGFSRIVAEIPRFQRVLDVLKMNNYRLTHQLKNYYGINRDASKLVKNFK